MPDNTSTHFHRAGSGLALNTLPTEQGLIDTLLTSDVPIGQIVRPFILECTPETPLYEAARRMSNLKVSSILVVENDQPVGVWTERDVLAIDFSDQAAQMQPVGEVMSAPVKTVSADLKIQELAVRFREERLRHYVVTNAQGKRCGVISQTDIVLNQGIEHYLKLRSIDTVVHSGLLTLPSTANLDEVSELMRSVGSDAVAIHYPNGEWGIITERDLVRWLADGAQNIQAGALASRPLLTVNMQTSLYRVRSLLVESHLRHVGVAQSDGALVGLVSFRDILSGMELTYIQELQQALHERDTALNASQRELHLAEKVIESSLEGIMVTDRNSNIVSVNPAFTRLTGYSQEEIIGKTPTVLSSGRHDQAFYAEMWRQISEQGHWQGEVWNRRKNGELFPEFMTITAITNHSGELTHYAALFNDISDLKANEERIRQLAYYDVLTGLPNRRLLEDRLHMATAHARRNQQQMAVLFIDLDRFKRINDSLGHEVGDQLLNSIAQRLLLAVREDDTVARMGGDEFVAILSDIDSPAQAVQVARRMLEALQQPTIIQGHELVVTVSIGISIYPDDGKDGELLLRNADAAMYRAKGSGRNAYQLYTPTMNARSLETLALESALHHALENDEFELYYQPQLEAGSGRIIAAEALLRWNHPDLGLTSPADFIPLAEETGLIISISEWVTKEACRQLATWQQQGFSELNISINIATRQFYHPDFCDTMVHCLQEAAVDPDQLTLELTESMLMDEALQTIRILNTLHGMGFSITLDDFGTGFSSLTHLRSFPLDELKIDRAFVRYIDHPQRKDAAIVSSVINLAHSLGLRVVAEGVETKEQMHFLQRHGCDVLQGFYFSPPVPVDQLTALLNNPPTL